MKEFDRWNELKKKTNKNIQTITIDEGDIRWCKYGINIGHETYGKGSTFSRPVIIVKKFSTDTFWGIPLTTKPKKGSWYFYIKDINRTAILNQLKLFDRKRLEERIYFLSHKELLEIKEKISSLLKS